MNNSQLRERIIWVARFATVMALLGRAYQHLFFDVPYRALFLDENFWSWAVSLWGSQDWSEYVISLETDIAITWLVKIVGVYLVITALAIIFLFRFRKLLSTLLITSSLCLFFMAFCMYLDVSFQWAQWIEHGSQFLMPVILVMLINQISEKSVLLMTKVAVALTFLGHGLYALGFYPVPGHFIHMVIENLHVSNDTAITFLLIAGILDVIVVVGIFIPRIDKYLLYYAIFWGFLTSLARLTTYIQFDHLFSISLHNSLYLFAYRIPHFVVPILALWLLQLLAREKREALTSKGELAQA